MVDLGTGRLESESLMTDALNAAPSRVGGKHDSEDTDDTDVRGLGSVELVEEVEAGFRQLFGYDMVAAGWLVGYKRVRVTIGSLRIMSSTRN